MVTEITFVSTPIRNLLEDYAVTVIKKQNKKKQGNENNVKTITNKEHDLPVVTQCQPGPLPLESD